MANGMFLIWPTQLLLTSFPDSPTLTALRSSFTGASSSKTLTTAQPKSWEWNTWEENWAKVVLPLIS